MEIRRFLPGDEDALSALIRRSLDEVNRPDCPVVETDWLYEHYTPAAVLDIAGRGRCYVLTVEGVPVGTGSILPAGPDESEIAAAFLLPEVMGRGYGTALFAALESDGLFTAASRVWLTASNTAMGFYEKRGWAYSYGYRRFNGEGLLEMEKRPGCPALCRETEDALTAAAAELGGDAPARLALCLESGGGGCAALAPHGETLGLAAWRPETLPLPGGGARGAVLELLLVAEPRRRQGVATRLFTHVERAVTQAGLCQLRARLPAGAVAAAALFGKLRYALCPDGAGGAAAARRLQRAEGAQAMGN